MRYNGFGWTLDYRPHEHGWPAPYRVRVLPNKQERQEYRVTAYGNTEQEAHENAERLFTQIKNVVYGAIIEHTI